MSILITGRQKEKEGQEKLFTTRGNGRRIPLNIKKHLFTVKERVLAKVVQRDCGVFLFRKTQEVFGHGPEQAAPGGPTGADGPSSSCQSILQFCLIITYSDWIFLVKLPYCFA